MRVSVVVNARNEEKSLERCLRSAAWADEIVVLDMSSEDETVAVARRHTDKVYSCPDFGHVEPARNLAVSHATGDWVFVLDADEVIPPRLAADVKKIIAESEGYALVAVPRHNYIGDYAIKNSGLGADHQPRLFQRGRVNWDDALHSWPQVDGETKYLCPDSGYYIKHYKYENLSDLVERLNRYTSVEAVTLSRDGEWAGWRDILGEVIEEFGKRYTPKEDGFHTLALAGCMAFYKFLARCKQLERLRVEEGDIIFPLPAGLEEIVSEALTRLPSAAAATATQAHPVRTGSSEQLRGLEEELARARAAYERQIEHLNEELVGERAVHAAEMSRLVEELTGARAAHAAEAAQHESRLAAQAAQIQAREAEVARLSDELAGAQAQMSDRESRLASGAKELARIRQWYDEQIARGESELAGYEAQLAQLGGELDAQAASLAAREAELEQQAASLAKLRARAEKSEQVLEWIHTSRSWQIASVVRRVGGLGQQWRQRLVSWSRGMRPPVGPYFYGLIESPTEAANAAGELEIEGWVFSPDAAITLVEAFLDDFYLGQITYGIKRADVAAAYPEQARLECGYSERITLSPQMAGRRQLVVRAYDSNGRSQIFTRSVVGAHRAVVLTGAAATNGKEAFAIPVLQPAEANGADPNFYSQVESLVNEFRGRMERDPAILNWNTGLNLATALPHLAVFSPPSANGHHHLPYLNHSVDIVVVPAGDTRRVEEAHRIASAAVVRAYGGDAHAAGAAGAPRQRVRLVTEWKGGGVVEAVTPSASIIIPVYNKVEYTENCLAQVLGTLPNNFHGEIIVVDDASVDGTPDALKRWAQTDERIKVLRNKKNEGFIYSCNRGAEVAHGEILIFLNNDTLPQPGWLPPLLRVFRERADAGAVGGKLLYPDGTLQEAGSIVFSDASGCNFGKRDKSPNAPLYSFLREVDYCSGALLATPRALFLNVGGFDARYAPAYYEDTDYCFTLREAGRKVYFQPESVVIHFEGVTSGTDIKNGVKSRQAANRLKFMEKWRHVLARHPGPPSRYDFNTLHALSVREEAQGIDAN